MKKKLTISVLSSFFFLISCNSNPSESTAETDSKEVTKEKYKNNIELIEFEKTNAVEKDETMIGGSKKYITEFNGKIKFLKDAYCDKRYSVGDELYQYDFEKPESTYSHFGKDYEKPLIKINKGEIKEVKGEISYTKKEKGWEVLKNGKDERIISIKFNEK
jgi:hypothetical protein